MMTANTGVAALGLIRGGLMLAAAIRLIQGSPVLAAAAPATITVTGEVVDAATSRSLPARVYIQDGDGRWFFAESTSARGSAVRYERRNWSNTNAVEIHTTISAHPFQASLPPGSYTITVERGKEYRPFVRRIEVGEEPIRLRFPLRRWIHMAELGWYSGDTHSHRDPVELPNVMLAEDLNVAWPMTYWTTSDQVAPSNSTRNLPGKFEARPVKVDTARYFYPQNTEYEIFESGGRRHTLGALLLLNHKSILDLVVPPVGPAVTRARAEGALVDLDKHNWEWSMVMAPVVKPDLFELANNHHWRTEYSVTNWALPAPDWMKVGSGTDDERDWTLYGFQSYYALLNCGLTPRPSAGTANGVHPVPLGFSRVYVHLDGPFSYNAWVRGLAAGRSFVTTGPMLMTRINGEFPGGRLRIPSGERRRLTVEGLAVGEQSVNSIELVSNGAVVRRIRPRIWRNKERAWESHFHETVEVDRSGWLAVRCFEEREGARLRFAHTAPTWFEVRDQPIRPKKQELEWLIERVQTELARSRAVLKPEAVAEYESALRFYQRLLPLAE